MFVGYSVKCAHDVCRTLNADTGKITCDNGIHSHLYQSSSLIPSYCPLMVSNWSPNLFHVILTNNRICFYTLYVVLDITCLEKGIRRLSRLQCSLTTDK
jgi:hypothetical protein